jgi:hypothetical protein
MSSGGPIARPGTDKMLAALSRSLAACGAQAQAYGACVQKLVPEVSQWGRGWASGFSMC